MIVYIGFINVMILVYCQGVQVQFDGEEVKQRVVVGAHAEHVGGVVWAVVFLPEGPDVMCLAIVLARANLNTLTAYLAGIVVDLLKFSNKLLTADNEIYLPRPPEGIFISRLIFLIK